LSSARLPLLVTGATGVAGFNALHYFQDRYPGHVVGIRPPQTEQLKGARIAVLDIEDRRGLRELFDQHRFRAVLNCVGNCALKSCELDPTMARRMNVDSAAAIVENVNAHGARMVHLSTDLVFSGTRGRPLVETDPIDPVTIYGKTMAEAEELLGATCPGAAMLRISLPMGRSLNRKAGAIDWIQWRFRNGRPATLYYDEVRSITYTDDMNRVFERFLAGDETGLYHLGGPRALTLYQIAQIVNRVGGYEPTLLKGCLRREAGPIPPRAGDCTMNSAKLNDLLGCTPFRPWPVGDDLLPTDRRWHFERPADERGSVERIASRLYHYDPAD